ncbi:MAG: hypothetical protein JJ866_04695 [Roseibium sp.]|uniref:hypothetical protein n=1 Tax=Roseibium sp. TaxID=1936156 RepID=UPI001B27CDC9|nr:hypothetical protein [Roseibium sp.]MBO6891221.1 hypothetical protein [Roseibium sp.]MBO6928738.1 hypothetical protein [Roseibium sp.]
MTLGHPTLQILDKNVKFYFFWIFKAYLDFLSIKIDQVPPKHGGNRAAFQTANFLMASQANRNLQLKFPRDFVSESRDQRNEIQLVT